MNLQPTQQTSLYDAAVTDSLTLYSDDGAAELSTYAGRLRFAMDKSGHTNQSMLARKVGVKPQAIQYLLDPRNNATGSKHTAALANALGISSRWLATGEGAMDQVHLTNDATFTPPLPDDALPVDPGNFRVVWVVGKGSGGLPERVWTDGDYPVGMTDEYGYAASADPHAFLVRVYGPSMIPVYNPGNFALVEPGTEPEIEDDVLVRLKSGETIIKRLVSRRDGYRFSSYNDPQVLYYEQSEVTWMYYIAHPVPRRRIKSRTSSA
ncbi:phage repressor protein C with HTH and peptisase S24 domain [Variovorax boronicumulans]|uniref:XRE family transcriptional regulator n=1 Tax=Variovorax boronicumulans TaxID=436515 RepID=UPI00277D1A55|nr:XRE family transcriptional regulator [Variovorax boronicumulans]MDP9990410.1 phage repressor protein C with HTH and peptisase S24 domain [Variovorax boronicumulans]MDQ0001079.1 phage repressor protein C with HTH and peptisase S24 domain [Variovorax boronicumulans]